MSGSQPASSTNTGETTAPSSTHVATPTTAVFTSPNTTTSPLATTMDITSGLSATVVSSTPSSDTPGLTTTSSQVGTTRTSQPTTSSSILDASSPTPATSSSSPSIPPSTTPSTAVSSSPVQPSSTTHSPTSSSLQQETPTTTTTSFTTYVSGSLVVETPTTITSSFTTYVSGSLVVSQTSVPTTIPVQTNSTSSRRAAIIGGSAAGGAAVLILLLSLAFFVRRKHFKRLSFLDAITRRRKQIRSRVNLLDDEDLDLTRPSPRLIDYQTPWDARANRDGSNRALIAKHGTSPAHASHRSETGPAFRQDDWSLPHESMRLMDPIATRDHPDTDLSRIVDDVMGPSATSAHYSSQSVSSMYRDSMGVSEDPVHSRTVSDASNAALLEAAGLGGGPSSAAPARPSPLARTGTRTSLVINRGEAI